MAVAVRVIPCLDVAAGRVVKGVNFLNLRDAGDPVELARALLRAGRRRGHLPRRDGDRRGPRDDVRHGHARPPSRSSSRSRSAAACDRPRMSRACSRSGADKVGRQQRRDRAARSCIGEIADRFGAQVLVLSLDVKRSPRTAAASS